MGRGRDQTQSDPEFRVAVRIVREIGKPIAQVAKDLGINAGTLANWVQMDRLAREQDTNGGDLAESKREELARLRRQRAEWACPDPPGGAEEGLGHLVLSSSCPHVVDAAHGPSLFSGGQAWPPLRQDVHARVEVVPFREARSSSPTELWRHIGYNAHALAKPYCGSVSRK